MEVGLVLKDPACALVKRIAGSAEQQGFGDLLFTELSVLGGERITGRDPFVSASIALGATTLLRAGTGIAGTVFHSARHLALRAATLQEQSGGRFILGCGVSHRAFADLIGVPYPRSPLTHTATYLEDLRAVNQQLAFGSPAPVWLAALGDRMAAVGGAHADGLVLNWVSPEWTRRTLEHVVAETGQRPSIAVFLRLDTTNELTTAADRYLRMFDNYARHFARQGLPDAASVVEATCARLDAPTLLAERVSAYHEAGADHVLLYPADVDAARIAMFVATTDAAALRKG